METKVLRKFILLPHHKTKMRIPLESGQSGQSLGIKINVPIHLRETINCTEMMDYEGDTPRKIFHLINQSSQAVSVEIVEYASIDILQPY